MVKIMLQCVSRVIIVVQVFVVKIVFSLEIVIGLQVIVMEDVNKDGWEVNVINVKLCFLSFLYFLYCESYIMNKKIFY